MAWHDSQSATSPPGKKAQAQDPLRRFSVRKARGVGKGVFIVSMFIASALLLVFGNGIASSSCVLDFQD